MSRSWLHSAIVVEGFFCHVQPVLQLLDSRAAGRTMYTPHDTPMSHWDAVGIGRLFRAYGTLPLRTSFMETIMRLCNRRLSNCIASRLSCTTTRFRSYIIAS
jgi:hypothetical protein